MQRQTDDVRILEIKELLPPIAHLYELPITDTASELIYATRSDIARMLRGEDDRLLVVIGPCSIHDPQLAIDYANKLKPLREAYAGELLVAFLIKKLRKKPSNFFKNLTKLKSKSPQWFNFCTILFTFVN